MTTQQNDFQEQSLTKKTKKNNFKFIESQILSASVHSQEMPEI